MTLDFPCGCCAERDEETGQWVVTSLCDMHSEQTAPCGEY
jgi:hypothetical protein